ncbi:phage integrase [Aurantiacibacter atlanticus]|uniref:Phage integrase n=1 Tax=Aurantiacibacter atlanticus TaxID=1648404 RepID=A0A0H4VYP2_9SPHN|nr:tyrosine recombinase XerC [Aurantiacibacter atlanticus]AKQ42273.1 phage integrase [Aurantiacibacter atlanticus]MDF1835416.1 tyrosine recombinase XerC [Alteraurantiacibacter sp. bin_em_oilr2.035]
MSGAVDLVGQWHMHLAQAQRRSPHTVRAYCTAAGRLLGHLELSDWEQVAAISTRDLRGYLAARRAEGIGNASTARELSALKGFINFALDQTGDVSGSAPRMRGPRLKKGLPYPVTPDEAVNLVESVSDGARDDWTGLRDAAVLMLMYGAGLRIAEALSLKAGDLPLAETLTVTGKGNKQRVVPILPEVREAVARYAQACPFPLERDAPLFRGVKGGPLGQGMVQKATARARKALGLPKTATPHAMRHSFATHLLGAGADMRSLQELLGHASLGSTQIYTKVDAATMLETYRAAHPREED